MSIVKLLLLIKTLQANLLYAAFAFHMQAEISQSRVVFFFLLTKLPRYLNESTMRLRFQEVARQEPLIVLYFPVSSCVYCTSCFTDPTVRCYVRYSLPLVAFQRIFSWTASMKMSSLLVICAQYTGWAKRLGRFTN